MDAPISKEVVHRNSALSCLKSLGVSERDAEYFEEHRNEPLVWSNIRGKVQLLAVGVTWKRGWTRKMKFGGERRALEVRVHLKLMKTD
jgi:hypothetical protein